MAYIAALTLAFIVLFSIALGFSTESWFLQFGLLIVAVSTASTIILAGIGFRKAAQAEKVDFDSFFPRAEEAQSHSFDFTGSIMGIDTNNPARGI